ncbi:hypothetical protein Dda_0262 [Drechslerella dactyloides]|uniref:N-glycosylation protein EOS1 n=1 Tax=Drechslerella dactyloides TaxID=74499 RepID=A0AAD6J6A2_DREDA|nr:hypothetical protein Dda_0262 [Drechslerella dactyloides]
MHMQTAAAASAPTFCHRTCFAGCSTTPRRTHFLDLGSPSGILAGDGFVGGGCSQLEALANRRASRREEEPGRSPPPLSHTLQPPPPPSPVARDAASVVSDGGGPESGDEALHPRIAVALGVDRRYHKWLMLARAASTLPAAAGFARCLFAGLEAWEQRSSPKSAGAEFMTTAKDILLAAAWTFGAGYQCFHFTDSLMTRWLVNYTPLATLVRLITITGIIAYFISGAHYCFGVKSDARMLLPAWITIFCTIGIGVHIVRMRISEYRELSTSITAFAALSFATMLVLLQDSHEKRERPPWREWEAWLGELAGAWWQRLQDSSKDL